ncbi:DUF262 domain-containing protein [Runella aurantiaca]|uniref:DUF262 domain-containing protein n=1 Tax=Runella aurantiaca TaxID=2282308 RepID=A0A369ICJ2_9BACT|nr:DUF262 domain-containing protein [Runella aurantiaca]RDB07491.1 DUF262 domain-containing protein [Runella aurantiaca]
MNISKEQLEEAEKQIFEEQQEVAYDTREFTIEYIVNKYIQGIDEDENEIFVPDYQRDFVWDNERQSKFIESVILGLPIPFIFVAEIRETGRLEIVDGSQRIRTLYAFLQNNLSLTRLEKLTKLNGLQFYQFSIARQRKLKNTPIRMIVLTDKASEQVRKDMFERINRGSDLLKDMEQRKALLQGEFTNFVYELCQDNRKLQKLAPIVKWLKNRQEHQELVLRYFALLDNYHHYPSHTGIAKFLDSYLMEKNLSFKNEEKIEKTNQFNKMLEFVEKNFEFGFAKSNIPQVSRVYFEAISVGVSLALKSKPNLTTSKQATKQWLKSSDFQQIISGKYETHTPKRINQRVDFVKNQLLKND